MLLPMNETEQPQKFFSAFRPSQRSTAGESLALGNLCLLFLLPYCNDLLTIIVPVLSTTVREIAIVPALPSQDRRSPGYCWVPSSAPASLEVM